MGARLAQVQGVEIIYKKSSGGVFEITADGVLKFSKKKLGRFPSDEEIESIAKAM